MPPARMRSLAGSLRERKHAPCLEMAETVGNRARITVLSSRALGSPTAHVEPMQFSSGPPLRSCACFAPRVSDFRQILSSTEVSRLRS